LYAVTANMVYPIFRPEDLANLHAFILHRGGPGKGRDALPDPGSHLRNK
jgi:hypothetical protein